MNRGRAHGTSKYRLFFSSGKIHWTKIIMISDNKAPVFTSIMVVWKADWGKQFSEETTPVWECVSEVIMGEIILFGQILDNIMRYFECLLQIIHHYISTIKHKKIIFICLVQELIGTYILEDSNNLSRSKFVAFWE